MNRVVLEFWGVVGEAMVIAGIVMLLWALAGCEETSNESTTTVTPIEVSVEEATEVTIAGADNWEFEDNTVDVGTDETGRQLRVCVPPCQLVGNGINLQVTQ